MLQLQFTKEEIEQLAYERYHHPHPRVQKKMEVLYLKSQRLSHQTIKQRESVKTPYSNIDATTKQVELKNSKKFIFAPLKVL